MTRCSDRVRCLRGGDPGRADRRDHRRDGDDGTGAEPVKDAVIVIDGGKITAVDRAKVAVPGGASDRRGRTYHSG